MLQLLKDALRQLWRDTRSQKLRTTLTVFGLVWGTVAVTLLLAFGAGLKKQLIRSTAGLGDRIAIAWPGLTSKTWQGLGRGRRIRLAEEDLRAVRPRIDGLRSIAAEFSDGGQMVYGTVAQRVNVSGVWPEFGAMRNLIPVEGGRFLNDLDERDQRRVIFLGNEVAKSVFGKENPVGKILMLRGSPFLVIGVLLEKDQDSSYNSRDSDQNWIPASTFKALWGRKWINNFIFQAETAAETPDVQKRLLASLASRQRFDPEDKEALAVWDTTEQFQFLETFMLAFSAFLGVVGSLTLVVGGIGVSNIMNVVVEERTREIGIKMALGARQRAILSQFLLETVLLTAVGGAIGFAISFGACAAFPKTGLQEYVGFPEVSPMVGLLTAAVLGAIGLIAGWFPAREASRLDPVVAMKL